MSRRAEEQVREILDEAARTSGSAPRGSARQQVGDQYAAGLDVDRIVAQGISPLAGELASIDAIDGPKSLAATLARLGIRLNDPVLVGAGWPPIRRTARGT
jgi:putative endopeptidase